MYNLTSISKIAMGVESRAIALMLLTNFYDVSWAVVFALIDPSSIVDEFSIFWTIKVAETSEWMKIDEKLTL